MPEKRQICILEEQDLGGIEQVSLTEQLGFKPFSGTGLRKSFMKVARQKIFLWRQIPAMLAFKMEQLLKLTIEPNY